MKARFYTILLLFLLPCTYALRAQLVITNHPNAVALAQRLVGEGITISNISFTGSPEMAGFFNNISGTNINIDSGIVLTNGRALARSPNTGLSGSAGLNAHNQMGFPGDADLSAIVNSNTNDACVLEFDFVPLGDSVGFNYVFSSEEYPDFSCSNFNDAFAFFISGPGFGGPTNIALVPGTTDPVTIRNINDQACALYPMYYVNNETNGFFTHNGHTRVFAAEAKVTPCETYHLKLVIADVVDSDFDSGVFLQAKSLSSNVIDMDGVVQTDPGGNGFLAEGCVLGAFNISRPVAEPNALIVNLSYGGTAVNGVDYQPLPAQVTIPANQTTVNLAVVPIIDGLPEGIEELKIYALAGCAAGLPTDSIIIQIRDYDILDLSPDTTQICRNSSVQLVATTGYATYSWNADPTLSSTSVRDPIATPVNAETTYICTATLGTCNARDSVFVKWKEIDFISKQDVFCQGATNGNIRVSVTSNWVAPVEYSLDGVNWQATGDFLNLTAGLYYVKVRDANCIDSIPVTIAQSFPDLVVDNTIILPASCTGGADGQISVTVSGGSNPYMYSLDGVNFQASNTFNVAPDTYTVTIKDINGCLATQPAIVTLDNIVTLDAGANENICEGTSFQINATSNADSYAWTPAATLSDATVINPIASPVTTTRYYVVATTGVCTQLDSIDIEVRPAPIADAGADVNICYGKTFTLNGAGGVSFQWSPSTHMTTPTNIASPTAKAVDNITYYLTVTDATGCSSVTPDEVQINVTPSVKIFAGNDTIVAMNQPLQLNAVERGTAGVTTWSWSPGNNLNDPNIENPVAILLQDQHYVVTGTTPDGCEGIDDILIKVYKGPDIYVPSAFSPNNDGRNDILKAIPVGIKEFKYFRIFNRWGQIVFSTQDFSKGWDGRINGVAQPTGTFVWIADGVDYLGNQVRRQGTITIIR